MMELKPLTREDCQKVRLWRNSDMRPWRTPYPLTEKMQDDFYDNVICNRESEHRYFGVWHKERLKEYKFAGMVGLTYIQPENRIAEISLIVNPEVQRKGLGEDAVDLILEYGFHAMRLNTIFGEVYQSNKKGANFWQKITEKYHGYAVLLPDRKFWDGQFYDSVYFSLNKENFKNENK